MLDQNDFESTARAVFDSLCDLIGATSGYVALLSDDGAENEILFLESGGLPCSVDESLPMPIRGLRAESYLHNSVVYDNNFMDSEWIKFLPEGHVYMNNVMFSPLTIQGKTVGIIGLANKDGDFDDSDAEIARYFGEIAALALERSRHRAERLELELTTQQVLEQLKVSESMYKDLFENLLGGYAYHRMIYDDDGKPIDYEFIEVNKFFEGIIGFPRSEIIGKKVSELIPEIVTDPADWIGEYGKLANKMGAKSFEEYSIGLGKWFIVNAYSYQKGYFATLFFDITSNKESERNQAKLERDLYEERLRLEQLKEMDQLKTRFMNTATHEIRTPITSIRGYTELIEDKLRGRDDAELLEYFEVVQRNVKRLETLSDDLLDLQRLETNRLVLEFHECEPITMMRDLRSELYPLISANNHSLVINQEGSIKMRCNKPRLIQVLVNLVNNAVKYSPAGSEITLDIRVDGDFIKFSVKDQGIGLSKEDHSKLFIPFPDINVRNVRHGSGLGLSICKGIVELHGGKIWAESSGRGKGSTFHFTIPCV